MNLEAIRGSQTQFVDRLANSRILSTERATWFVVTGVSTVVGLLIRTLPVRGADFPLNDGGLFTLMAREIRDNGFRLPAFTSYNSGHIPFAYPPLGLYMTAVLSQLMHWPILDIVRIMPALVSTAAIPAFALLAWELLPSLTQRSTAIVAFALLPGTFQWLVMGGGLTRAPGMVAGILTLWAFARLFRQPSVRMLAITAFLAGITLLSHLEWTYFVAYSGLILYMYRSRTKRGLTDMVLVGGGAAIMASPWWMTVIARHGVTPFLLASRSRPQSMTVWLDLFSGDFTRESLIPVFAVLGLIGLLVCLSKRQAMLPLWLIAVFVVQPGGHQIYATIPLALLAGVGLDQAIIPVLRRSVESVGGSPLAFRAAVFVVALIPLASAGLGASSDLIQPLPQTDRLAMAWVSQNTPLNSRFVLFTAYAGWDDRTWEWFPVLADRISLNTAQGYEWTPDFLAREDRTEQLYNCEHGGVACLDEWSIQYGQKFSFVYIQKNDGKNPTVLRPNACCIDLQMQLEDAGYKEVYENSGVVILARPSAVLRGTASGRPL